MQLASEAIRKIFEKHFPILQSETFEPFLAELRAFEVSMVREFAENQSTAVNLEQLQELGEKLYGLRIRERGLDFRRRRLVRITLDGPGEWMR